MKKLLVLGLLSIILSACEGGGGDSGGALSSGGGGSGSGSGSGSGGGSSSAAAGDYAMKLRLSITPEAGTDTGETFPLEPISVTFDAAALPGGDSDNDNDEDSDNDDTDQDEVLPSATCDIPSTVDPYDNVDQDVWRQRFITCTFSVTEELLYFSKVTLKLGTDSPMICKFPSFTPYYYRASNSATFYPFWNNQAEVDCSGGAGPDPVADDPNCWNGPAKAIFDDFPNSYDVNINTDIDDDGFYTYPIPSGASRKARSNRWIANMLPNTMVARPNFNGSDGYVTNIPALVTSAVPQTYSDYTFSCEDNAAELLYNITLKIKDYAVIDINPTGNDDDDEPGDDSDNDANTNEIRDNPLLNDLGDWDSDNAAIDPQP